MVIENGAFARAKYSFVSIGCVVMFTPEFRQCSIPRLRLVNRKIQWRQGSIRHPHTADDTVIVGGDHAPARGNVPVDGGPRQTTVASSAVVGFTSNCPAYRPTTRYAWIRSNVYSRGRFLDVHCAPANNPNLLRIETSYSKAQP